MGLSMMEKNLVTKYFETFQMLDGSFSLHLTIDRKSMRLILTFCDHNWNQTSLTLPIFIRKNLQDVMRGNENKKGLEYSLAFFYISG